MKEVLVFVPGTLGSELHDEDGMVWPGTMADGLFGFSEARFARLLSPTLRVGDILRTAAGVVNVYGPWIRVFQSLRNRDDGRRLFDEGIPHPTLVTVPYDWRRSIDDAASVFADAIATTFRRHGPDVRIHIAAHSMGGLVARYFLQSGEFEDREGFKSIASLSTFGTPHRGSAAAIAGAMGLEAARFLSKEQTRRLANDPRYPSLYQLFPHERSGVIWDNGSGGRLTPRDPFSDRSLARQLGLHEPHLDTAATLHRALRARRLEVQSFLFVGTRFETLTHFLYDGRRLTPIHTKDAGDGTVALQGSVIEDHVIRFTNGNHLGIIDSNEANWTLQSLFDADGILGISSDTEISIDVGDIAIEHGGQNEVRIAVKGAARSVEGTLQLERARPAPGSAEVTDDDYDTARPEKTSTLIYLGPQLVSIHVMLEDLSGPAIYRPVFVTREDRPRRFVGSSFVVRRPV